jgi:class 3 adenylate cyclase
VDETTGPHGAVISYRFETTFSKGTAVSTVCMNQRIFDSAGRYLGVMMQAKPAVGMSVISQVVATGDLGHFERMHSVSRAQRQSAGILFADLEGSSRLSRRLSTAAYFALGRRLVGAADAAVVEAGGIVGRHVGDGVVAFFLASTSGSEAAAAEACVRATRTLRTAVAEVAERSDLEAGDVTLRFGLHWGSTLYMGLIATSGRSEVTALGDEVNETARIEACATGGRALASKELIERLDRDAAESLGINQERVSYTALADLTTATDKARRDAPVIAVTEI